MKISHTKALFLLIDNRSMPSLSRTIAELYNDYRNDDGFLYITYASQDVFGKFCSRLQITSFEEFELEGQIYFFLSKNCLFI